MLSSWLTEKITQWLLETTLIVVAKLENTITIDDNFSIYCWLQTKRHKILLTNFWYKQHFVDFHLLVRNNSCCLYQALIVVLSAFFTTLVLRVLVPIRSTLLGLVRRRHSCTEQSLGFCRFLRYSWGYNVCYSRMFQSHKNPNDSTTMWNKFYFTLGEYLVLHVCSAYIFGTNSTMISFPFPVRIFLGFHKMK